VVWVDCTEVEAVVQTMTTQLVRLVVLEDKEHAD
jgi:hypothetical protein